MEGQMNCNIHYGREAHATCSSCNAGICSECETKYMGMCKDCAGAFVKHTKKEILITISLSLVFLVWGIKTTIIDLGVFSFRGILEVFLCAMIPFGWRALSKITSKSFLIIPFVGLLIYIFVKFILSLIIGWIVAIPEITKLVKNTKAMIAIEKEMNTP